MSVDKTIDTVKAKDQKIDKADRIDEKQLTDKLQNVDSFLSRTTDKKLANMKDTLPPEDYRDFEKRMAFLKKNFDGEIANLQYKLDNLQLEQEEEFKKIIESYTYVFDGMEEDMLEFEHLLGDDAEIPDDEMMAKVKSFSYAALGLNENTYDNGNIKQLIKGVVDSMVIENIELAKQVFETKGAVLVDMVKTIFSWDGIKQIAKGLGESIWGLFSGDVYKTGRSIGELGLITTGAGVVGMGMKKVAKVAMKQSTKTSSKLVAEGLQKAAKTMDTTGTILQAPAKGVLKTGKGGKDVAVKGIQKGEELLTDGTAKFRDKLEDSKYGRILANERGGWGPTDELVKEFPETKSLNINTVDYHPDFIPESVADIGTDKARKIMHPEALQSKINEMLDAMGDATRREKFDAVSKMVIETLAKKDLYTAGHVLRVAKYAEMLGNKLVEMGRMTPNQLADLKTSVLLHDIGKFSMDNNVLRKVGKLTDEEFSQVRLHVASTEDILGNTKLFDEIADKDIICGASLHHERPDGKGYPYGMTGEQIPDFAHIASIADTFDAITSNRLHDSARPLEVANKIILSEGGKQLHKEMGQIFVNEIISQDVLNQISRDVNRTLRNLNSRFNLNEENILV